MKLSPLLLATTLLLGCTGEVSVDDTPVPRDCNGSWTAIFGDQEAQGARGVSTYPDGDIALVGYFVGAIGLGGPVLEAQGLVDVFVARLDACGGHLWSRAFGGSNKLATESLGSPFVLGPLVGADERVTVVGRLPGATDLGDGPLGEASKRLAVLLTLDPAGAYVSSRLVGSGDGEVTARAVALAPDGDIVVVGELFGKVALGDAELETFGDLTAFVARFDAGGAYRWSETFRAKDGETSFSGVRIDAAGEVIITGDATGGPVDLGGGALPRAGHRGDAVVLALSADGIHRWSKRFGGSGEVRSTGVALGAKGDILLTGSLFNGFLSIGDYLLAAPFSGSYLARLDATGNVMNALALPEVAVRALAPVPSGEFLVDVEDPTAQFVPIVGTFIPADAAMVVLKPSLEVISGIPLPRHRIRDIAVDARGGVLAVGAIVPAPADSGLSTPYDALLTRIAP